MVGVVGGGDVSFLVENVASSLLCFLFPLGLVGVLVGVWKNWGPSGCRMAFKKRVSYRARERSTETRIAFFFYVPFRSRTAVKTPSIKAPMEKKKGQDWISLKALFPLRSVPKELSLGGELLWGTIGLRAGGMMQVVRQRQELVLRVMQGGRSVYRDGRKPSASYRYLFSVDD